jgi:hypothetical protein
MVRGREMIVPQEKVDSVLGRKIVCEYVSSSYYHFPSALPEASIFYLFFFFFGWDWGLNSGACACKASALMLDPQLQSILLWLFWRWGLANHLPEQVDFLSK